MSKREIRMTTVGVLVGFIAGYAYYYFIGCASGTCAITSNPFNSTLYGGVLGGLLFNGIFETPKNKAN
ncbi:MAG: hypothetical protein IPO65_02755 [Saprospiraceae bacterium]|nr:hypothetical protein [Saprospiraceae bacterium]